MLFRSIKKYLMEKMQIPDYKADVCTAFAQGNMGRAIMLANSEHFNEVREEAVQLLKYIHEMELSEIVNAVNHITVYKLEISDYLDLIMIWYRDVLMYKATKELDKVVFKDQIQYIIAPKVADLGALIRSPGAFAGTARSILV